MERRQNLFDMVRAMPLAHQVTIGIAVAVLAMAGYLFFQWVSTPTYAVLYTNLEDGALSEVVDELERQGVPYEIEAGGSRVLVPRGDVYRIRGNLAASGVRTGNAPEGYELLDGQGLNVSDFRHIGGIDTLAQSLLVAAALVGDGDLEAARNARYAGWDSELGSDILRGDVSLDMLEQRVAAGEIDPAAVSGGQERLENLVNRTLWKATS